MPLPCHGTARATLCGRFVRFGLAAWLGFGFGGFGGFGFAPWTGFGVGFGFGRVWPSGPGPLFVVAVGAADLCEPQAVSATTATVAAPRSRIRRVRLTAVVF